MARTSRRRPSRMAQCARLAVGQLLCESRTRVGRVKREVVHSCVVGHAAHLAHADRTRAGKDERMPEGRGVRRRDQHVPAGAEIASHVRRQAVGCGRSGLLHQEDVHALAKRGRGRYGWGCAVHCDIYV
eukprot:2452289-Pleurochrysis_carterae.AAC.3